AHQRGDEAGRLVEQEGLRLAARKARLLPFHLRRAHDVGMLVGGDDGLRRDGVHGVLLRRRAVASIIAHRQATGTRRGWYLVIRYTRQAAERNSCAAAKMFLGPALICLTWRNGMRRVAPA